MDYAFEILQKIGFNSLDYPEASREINTFVEEKIRKNAQQLAETKFEEKREEFCLTERKNIREEFRTQKSRSISGISPFISDCGEIEGFKLQVKAFIYNSSIPRPYDNKSMVKYNPYTGCYERPYRKDRNTFISKVDVICILVVNPSPPNVCDAFVVFVKGRDAPFILWDGDLSDNTISSQLPFDRKAVDRNFFAESVRLAIGRCENIFFYTSPKHGGWNYTSDGAWFFVHEGIKPPLLAGLYKKRNDKTRENKRKLDDVFENIRLCSPTHDINELVEKIRDALSDDTILKAICAFSFMSRLLPFYGLNGLRQDRILVIESIDDNTTLSLLAFLQNSDINSFHTSFSSDSTRELVDEIHKHIDSTFIVRHRANLNTRSNLKNILNIFSKILDSDDVSYRTMPSLIIDTVGSIPEDIRTIYLTPDKSIHLEDVLAIKKLLGEFHCAFTKKIEKNFDAFSDLLKKNIAIGEEYVLRFPERLRSNSLLMCISSVLSLKNLTLFSESDVEEIIKFLTNSSGRSQTDMICDVIRNVLSDLICSEKITVTTKFTSQYCIFISHDGALNATSDTFKNCVMSRVNPSWGQQIVLKALDENGLLISNQNEGYQNIIKVNRLPKRVYTFSPEMLDEKANLFVEKVKVNGYFLNPDISINHFIPFMMHPDLNMIAGLSFPDYKQGNPFCAVTGSPGFGKTDWLIQQAILRAEAGDNVILLDPTNSFTKDELIGHRIPKEIIERYFSFWDMSLQGWPVNIVDFLMQVEKENAIQMLSSLLISGMHITGLAQKDLLVSKLSSWLDKTDFDKQSPLACLGTLISLFDDKAGRKLLPRIKALFSSVGTNKSEPQGWDELFSIPGKITVISTGNGTSNVASNPLDVIADSIYSYKDSHRDKKVTIILDEFQTFNRHPGCTLENFFSRGRKLNISVIISSQDYSDEKDNLGRFYAYCGTKIFFRPLSGKCVEKVVKVTHIDQETIETLPVFHFIITGSLYNEKSNENTPLRKGIHGITYHKYISGGD